MKYEFRFTYFNSRIKEFALHLVEETPPEDQLWLLSNSIELYGHYIKLFEDALQGFLDTPDFESAYEDKLDELEQYGQVSSEVRDNLITMIDNEITNIILENMKELH